MIECLRFTNGYEKGEGIGTEEGDEHWRIRVSSINDDGTIDILAEKTVMDETGLNKEGDDPMYKFERTQVEMGDIERIEDDFRVAYIGHKDEEVHIGFDSTLYREDVNEILPEDSGSSDQST